MKPKAIWMIADYCFSSFCEVRFDFSGIENSRWLNGKTRRRKMS